MKAEEKNHADEDLSKKKLVIGGELDVPKMSSSRINKRSSEEYQESRGGRAISVDCKEMVLSSSKQAPPHHSFKLSAEEENKGFEKTERKYESFQPEENLKEAYHLNLLREVEKNAEEKMKNEINQRQVQAEMNRKQEEIARLAEINKKQEEITRLAEISKKQEEIARLAEISKKQEEIARLAEISKKQEEIARQAEINKKQEEIARQAEINKKQEEIARLAEMNKKQEETLRDMKQEEMVRLAEMNKKLLEGTNVISELEKLKYEMNACSDKMLRIMAEKQNNSSRDKTLIDNISRKMSEYLSEAVRQPTIAFVKAKELLQYAQRMLSVLGECIREDILRVYYIVLCVSALCTLC